MSPILALGALLIVSYGVRVVLRRVYSVLDNVPGPPRTSIMTGNLAQFHNPDDWGFQQQLEENYGGVVKIQGLLGDRELYVFDPAALHNILVQEPDVYEQPPKFLALDCLMWGKGYSQPAWTNILDLNSVLRRTALELIGRTGIGYSFDRMLHGEEETDPYAESLRLLFPTAFKMQLLIPLLPLLVNNFPPSFLRFMIKFIPLRPLHELRDLVDYTDGKAAELSGKLEVDDGKDIMSCSNASAESGMHLSDAELVGCTSQIMFAATDTTSSSMNRLFHVLALYPDVQKKLRAEILSVPEQLDHDTLIALPYLDGVIREVLRLYPPASPVMFRDYEGRLLPLSTPITGVDGKVMTSIPVPKGTQIYIAISAANHNKNIWGEDALEFKPERGVKFAQLEMKVAACILVAGPRIKWRKPGIMPSPFVDNEPSLPILVEQLKD
ncbi:cytochrome P450 [Mycena leptocephala]|nr:cytochrome P450 [Mycena leptocephala]